MTTPTLPSLPARGRTISFSEADQVGRIRLGTGLELRFGATACIGFQPVTEAEVFVVEADPHPLGGFRARVVNQSGIVEQDRISQARAESQRQQAIKEARRRAFADLTPQKEAALAALPKRLDVVKAAGLWEVLSIELLAQVHRHADAFADALAERPLAQDITLDGFEFEIDAWWDEPEDPCFFSLGGVDGDALGLYVFPPALARREPPPVVLYFHELAPTYSVVADSFPTFLRGLAAGSGSASLRTLCERIPPSPDLQPPNVVREAISVLDVGGEGADRLEDERRCVHTLVWNKNGARTAEASLADLYRRPGWELQRAALRYQQTAREWDRRIAEALSKLPLG